MNLEYGKVVKDEISGEIAKSYVAQIVRFHRVQASTMFREASEYVADTLKSLGFKDAEIEHFASDGATKYWTWRTPIGWAVKTAELYMVEPEKKLIVRYEDVPTCLHTYSNATPPEGVTAELVDVGEGIKPRHYRGKNVKGKLVLATGKARSVHEQAVFKYGAAGVITDSLTHEIENVRESVDIPDAHAYQSIWTTREEFANVAFGFSLSKRQGNHLRSRLRGDKPVKLKAIVDATLFPSSLDVVTATIQGSSKPDEEIFLIAHLCHPKPSANDNASGSGLLLEIARALQVLIKSGKIDKPLRTIRFLWVPESFGTIAYLFHHEDSTSKLVAGINLDMVGQHQELCKSTLRLDRTPDSNPSYLNDYVFSLFERSVDEFDQDTAFGSASTFRYSVNAFCGASDHAEFNDSSFSIPCVMLIQWPDLYYHSSMDTIENVDEKSLKRVGWIATVAALTLASANVENSMYMANLTRWGGLARLQRIGQDSLTALFRAKNSQNSRELPQILAKIKSDFENKMRHIIWREKEAIKSTAKLGNSAEVEAALSKYMEDLEQAGQLETERFEDALGRVIQTAGIVVLPQLVENVTIRDAKNIVPQRLFKGTLNLNALKKALGEEEFEWHENIRKKDREFGKKTYEVVNFMDGKRSVYDIAAAISAEYGETKLEHILKFVRDLAKTNFASFKQ